MPEYLDFDALKAFFSDSQIVASLKRAVSCHVRQNKKNRQHHLPAGKTSYPNKTNCLMFSDQDTLPELLSHPDRCVLFGEDRGARSPAE